MKVGRYRAVLILLAMLLVAPQAFASISFNSPIPTSHGRLVERMFKKSPVVVEGIVVTMNAAEEEAPEWFPDGLPFIVSTINLEVDRVIKGMSQPPARVAVRLLGGCVSGNNDCLRVSDGPELRIGEKVILYLMPTEDGLYYLSDPVNGVQPAKKI